MKFLKNIRFKSKITLLVLPALLGLVFFGAMHILNDIDTHTKTKDINQLIQLSMANSALVHELQRERGASVGFLGAKGQEFAAILIDQRIKTDEALQQYQDYLDTVRAKINNAEIHLLLRAITQSLKALGEFRQNIDNFSLNSQQVLHYYSDINSKLIDIIPHLSQQAGSARMANHLQAYYHFLQGKERAGQERALLSKIFTHQQVSKREYRQFLTLVAEQSVFFNSFYTLADRDIQRHYSQAMEHSAVRAINDFRQIARQFSDDGDISRRPDVDSTQWFNIATIRINLLKQVESQVETHLTSHAAALSKQAISSLWLTTLVMVLVTLMSIALAVSIARLLTRQVRQIFKTINHADKTGKLDARAVVNSTDELGEIATQLNKMLQALAEAMDKIEANNSQLKLAQAFFEYTSECVVITDHNNKILTVNKSFEKTTGYTQADLRGKGPSALASGRHGEAFYKEMWHKLNNFGSWRGEIWNRRKNGEIYPEELSINVITDPAGKIVNFIAVFRDITEWKEAEEQLAFYAYNDPLTGLPNRRNFVNKVKQHMATAQRYRQQFSILFVDIDLFKSINDIHGHDIGDKLLLQIAQRLKQTVRKEDVVSRYGGDEFTLLLMKASAGANTEIVANKILTALNQPYYVEDIEINITPSIGVALYPDNGVDCHSLLKHADHAMYKMKQQGRNGIYFYDDSLQFEYLNKLMLKDRLIRAIADNALSVHYQPIVDISTGKICKFEALLRWIDETQSTISPAVFIPIAEEYSLIKALGQFVLSRACEDLKALHRMGFEDIAFSVNRSVKEFINYSNQEQSIEQIIAQAELDPKSIIIEVTESTAMQDSSSIPEILQGLKNQGIRIALDDFGTGYSSLSSLIDFQADIIKIDRSFIKEITENYHSQSLTALVIQLANSLGMEIVAEGVENREQLAILQGYGCRQIQGFYFSPARPIDQCIELLRQDDPFSIADALPAPASQSS